jgi:Dehydrogenases with different specificities (related to short-chain alcohol dehydrogenases)
MPLALITGANTGLGFETARGLLAQGFQVVLTSRDQTRAQTAIERLQDEYPKAVISSLPLDLSIAASVDGLAPAFSDRYGNWDVLINNAGAKALLNYSETDSGIEYHYGVNAVGHFAITADLLKFRAPVSRVVTVSSIVARWANPTLGPLGSKTKYSRGESYAASKLSNLLFALELERRFGSSTFSSVAAHPGFARAEPYGPASTRFFESLLAQSASRGALPIIEAASEDNVAGGSYRAPKILELWGVPAQGKLAKSCTLENQETNWQILQRLSERKLVL